MICLGHCRIMRSTRESGSTRRAPRGDRGATAVEYGLVVALVAVVILVGVVLVGNGVARALGGTSDAFGSPGAVAGDVSGSEDAPADAPAESPAEAPAPVPTPTPTAYAGDQPRNNYAASGLRNSGSYSLPSIASISYSDGGCGSERNDGCDEYSLSGSTIRVDRKWDDENRRATVTVRWSIPATSTTLAASGTFTVQLT